MSTAKFALQSWYDLGTLIPLVRASSFGRSFLDLWILLALFGVASLVAIAIDRPTRSVRSVAELLATASGLIAAGAVLEIPGIAGHAAQTSPAALALGLDWVHLVSGSLWIGGLAGLLVLWFSTPPGRRRATPRARRAPLLEGGVRLGDGAARVGRRRLVPAPPNIREPVEHGATARRSSSRRRCSLSRCCLRRRQPAGDPTAPRRGGDPARGLAEGAPRAPPKDGWRRRSLLVVFGGGFRGIRADEPAAAAEGARGSLGSVSAHVGPGLGLACRGGVGSVHGSPCGSHRTAPRCRTPSRWRSARGGKPVRGAEVTMRFTMLDMDMQQQVYTLSDASRLERRWASTAAASPRSRPGRTARRPAGPRPAPWPAAPARRGACPEVVLGHGRAAVWLEVDEPLGRQPPQRLRRGVRDTPAPRPGGLAQAAAAGQSPDRMRERTAA